MAAFAYFYASSPFSTCNENVPVILSGLLKYYHTFHKLWTFNMQFVVICFGSVDTRKNKYKTAENKMYG